MPLAVLPAFLAFTLISAFTPGPNNILALRSASRNGFRGSSQVLLVGICTGFLCVMFLCGALTLTVNSLSASVITAMKYVGCAYIVWLARKIAFAAPPKAGTAGDVRFLSGFILQFLNIKIIVYGITAFTGFLLPYSHSAQAVMLFGLALTAIGCGGVLSWAVAGAVFQNFLTRHARAANAVMGALLLACAASPLVMSTDPGSAGVVPAAG